MSMTEHDHDWFAERIATYLAGGLDDAERTRFDSHAAACPSCAAELRVARRNEAELAELFTSVRPSDDFEDKLIAGLGAAHSRRFIGPRAHPWVRHAAAAVAASIVVGLVGYVGTEYVITDHRTTTAADLKSIGQAPLSHSNDSHGRTPNEFTAPSSNAEKWDFGGGNSALPWKGLSPPSSVGNASPSTQRAFDTSDSILLPHGSNGDGPTPDRLTSRLAEQLRGKIESKGIPYNDILRYPENWPELSEMREKSVAAERGELAIDAAARAQLDRILPEINFNAVPFADVVEFLRDITQAHVFVNWKALEQAGVDRSTPVNAQMKNVKLSAALRTLLDSAGGDKAKLNYTIDEGVISVSTAEDLGKNVITRVYDIRDLRINVPDFVGPAIDLRHDDGGAGPTTQATREETSEALISLVQGTVATDSWRDHGGGSGSIRELGGQLIVTQTPENQVAVARLIEQLHQTRGNQPTTQPEIAGQQPVVAGEQRAIIRTGTMEIEVESFDQSFDRIKQLVAEERGYVGGITSDKLPNGKVRGTLVLRVPPDRTDAVVTRLRALGELKRQNLSAEEVTKQLFDLERMLETAQTMQQRLGELSRVPTTGPVTDRVDAEREAGQWRQKAEHAQSQIASIKNQVQLATLTVMLSEKGLDASAAVREVEAVDIGVETEDVEKARSDAMQAIDEVQGRIVESHLQRHDAEQLAARVIAEVPHDRAGGVIDRLKQLGKVARLDVQRQTSTAGNTTPVPGSRVERQATRIVVSFYNLANLSPRVTSNASVACEDVEAAHRAIIDRVEKANGRIIASNVARQASDAASATIQFEVKSADADAVLNDLRGAGELMKLESTRNTDAKTSTEAKRGFSLQLISYASAAPRQLTTRAIAAVDVTQAYEQLFAAARKAKARVVASKLEQPTARPASAWLDFELRADDTGAIEAALAEAGDSISGNVIVASDPANTLASKARYQISLSAAELLPPRETTSMTVETRNPAAAIASITKAATDAGGKSLDSSVSSHASGQTTARLALDVPLLRAAEVIDQARASGSIRSSESTRDPQAPAGSLARARVQVIVVTPDTIVGADGGFWSSIRTGLSTSAAGLMWSVKLIVIGVCLIAPWALLVWGAWRVAQRYRASRAGA